MAVADSIQINNARVLVADDDAVALGLVEKVLTGAGCEVVSADDGKKAYEKIRHAPPDLVILDVRMPGLSGIDLCRRIKESPRLRLTPVILMTGDEEMAVRIEGIDSNADDFLTKPITPELLLHRSRSLIRLKRLTDNLEYAEDVLFSMASAVEAKDTCTKGHTERVAKLALKIGFALKFSEQEMEDLRRGAILHDIGKIGIPDAILNKPGRLTGEEREIMMSHPRLGFNICSPLRSLKGSLDIVAHHHERLDGSGYPDGLKDDEIKPIVRVMCAVDVFDALRSDRPYKAALPMEAIRRIMREEVEKGYWDSDVVETMLELGLELPPDVTRTPAIRTSGSGADAPLAL